MGINRFHTPAEYKLIDTYGVVCISSGYQDVPRDCTGYQVLDMGSGVQGCAIENRLGMESESFGEMMRFYELQSLCLH